MLFNVSCYRVRPLCCRRRVEEFILNPGPASLIHSSVIIQAQPRANKLSGWQERRRKMRCFQNHAWCYEFYFLILWEDQSTCLMFFKHQINLEERLNETRTKRLSSINYLNRIFSLFEQTIKNLHTHFIMQLPTHPIVPFKRREVLCPSPSR